MKRDVGHPALLSFHAAAACHAADAFEAFGHLGVLAQEVVDLLHGRGGASNAAED